MALCICYLIKAFVQVSVSHLHDDPAGGFLYVFEMIFLGNISMDLLVCVNSKQAFLALINSRYIKYKFIL